MPNLDKGVTHLVRVIYNDYLCIEQKLKHMSIEKAFSKFIENVNSLREITHYEDEHGEGVDTKETATNAIKEYENLLNKLNESFNQFKNSVNTKYKEVKNCPTPVQEKLVTVIREVPLKNINDKDVKDLLTQVENTESLVEAVRILVLIIYNAKDINEHRIALRNYSNTLRLIKTINKFVIGIDTSNIPEKLYTDAKTEINNNYKGK